jgi:hypothetical protein
MNDHSVLPRPEHFEKALPKAMFSGEAEGSRRPLAELLLKHDSSHDAKSTPEEALYWEGRIC